MSNDRPLVRQNYPAILVAAIVCFLFEATWYSFFLKNWLSALGRPMQWLESPEVNLGLQCAVAILSETLIAMAISSVTQRSGPQTLIRGMKVGALASIAFVLPTFAVGYVFEARSFTLFAIDVGFWLVGMTIMGAIVGAWKKK